MESYKALEVNMLEKDLVTKSVEVNSVRSSAMDIDADAMKNLSFKLRVRKRI